MKKNPIRKMHVGWTSPWENSGKKPESIRRWVAVCPRCNVKVKPKSDYYYGYAPRNSRKTAKDALHHHMRVFH